MLEDPPEDTALRDSAGAAKAAKGDGPEGVKSAKVAKGDGPEVAKSAKGDLSDGIAIREAVELGIVLEDDAREGVVL